MAQTVPQHPARAAGDVDEVRAAFLRSVRTVAGEIETHPRWPALSARDAGAAGAVLDARDAVARDGALTELIGALWRLAAVVERLAAPAA